MMRRFSLYERIEPMYRARIDRKCQIISHLYLAWLQGRKLTVNQIADRVGLKPSSHLRKMLYEMVTQGTITVQIVSHRPNMNKSLFSVDMLRLKRIDREAHDYLEEHIGTQRELFA